MTTPKYTLLIKSSNETVEAFYKDHSTYHTGDSGLDLFTIGDKKTEVGETYFLNLGIECEMIENSTGRNVSYYLYPRSSLSKTPLRLANSVGIIDAGYRGSIIAAVDHINRDYTNEETYTIKNGTRLVQICSPNLEPFDFKLVSELSKTKRGAGGFGSTNQKVETK
ncbi:MAG: deoxyuridine 5'-triphosphate nucleotidohydrolase [Magnetococcales bacterium]|nr:deoxyuridine 5'-triphosphate nucleotidohydrolase [Magnetococcales bacterium]|tara:strand:- start:21121 stop:21618 length:498 start_codon:yes stop_codon:yes gene_type:complete